MRKGGKKRKLNVRLKKRNQDEIESLLGGGVHSIRVIKRAQSLRLLARGERPPQVASAVGLSAKAVREIGWRYVDSGDLKGVLYEAPRPGAPPLLTDTEAQRIIAMVCSDGTSVPDAPQGRARWTVRLIAEEAVKRNLAATVGRETIRVLLKSHDLKPWREKRWCVAELTPEYIERMEDVLATYEKPLDPQQPVVCLDEKPVPCGRMRNARNRVREPLPARKPGQIAKYDNEYKRCGRANIFGVVEPKVGRHFTTVTPNRSGAAFAKVVKQVADAYPQAETIHLVLRNARGTRVSRTVDNLNTHSRKMLIDSYGEEEERPCGTVSPSTTRPCMGVG